MSANDDLDPPFSKSADANKDHILDQLKSCLKPRDRILEIASGTGQHALHFARQVPEITWQCSDVDLASYRLSEVVANSALSNLPVPKTLDIGNWPNLADQYDAVYSANCIHIIGSELVAPYVTGAANSLKHGGLLLLYGPYKYGGEFTTPSNENFDGFLRSTGAGGGIKDFETVDRLAIENGLVLEQDIAMPANNQFLIWRKTV